MQDFIKTGLLVCAILFFNTMAGAADPVFSTFGLDNLTAQQDSIRGKTLVNALNYYKTELNNGSADSLECFKKIALISAELRQPNETVEFTQKYIDNTADISILHKDSYDQILDTDEYEVLKNKYLPKGNILIFIYVYIVLIGIFFAILINFKRDSDKASNILLGGFVTVHSLFILEFAIYASNLSYLYPHTFLMSSSVALLYGPFLYFYFKRINQQYVLKPKDALHFIPTVLLLAVLLPFYALSAKEKLNIMFDISAIYSRHDFLYIVFIPKLSSYIIYGFFIGKLYFNKQSNMSTKNDDILVKWKRNIYYIHIMYILAYAFYGITISGILIVTKSEAIYHFQVLAMSLMVLYIAQTAYLQPKVFNYGSFILKNGISEIKYLKSGLTEALSEELKGELIKLFTEGKVYRDSNLSLEALSEKLNTTRHNTSQIINEHFDMNFFELINKFRIEEAVNLLLEDKNGNLNIIDIAYEVGYNNKVTFNKAFKKTTSLTPTQFIDSIRNQPSKPIGNYFREA